MNRTDVTYGQLNKVLRSLGYTCRFVNGEPPARVYEHKATGAAFTMPPFADDDLVYEHHLVAARVLSDGFGVIDAKDFDAKLKRTRRRKVHKSAE
jgi:hypothetical protein